MELPTWALLVMWGATLVGTWQLSKVMIQRFGHG